MSDKPKYYLLGYMGFSNWSLTGFNTPKEALQYAIDNGFSEWKIVRECTITVLP